MPRGHWADPVLRTCVHCKAAFQTTSPRRKYCHPKCKNSAGARLRIARNGKRAERTCYRCGATKPSSEFSFASHSYCTACTNAYQRERTAATPAEVRRVRRRRYYEREDPARRIELARRGRWGLNQAELDALLLRQGNRCAICRTPDPGGRGTWHVDHDHSCCPRGRSCGKCIRGLLCSRCNVGLGHFRDDPELLIAAARYVQPTT